MTNCLVSVIVPCYNYGVYLNQLYDCLFEVKDCRLEIILIDDHSTLPYSDELLKLISDTETIFVSNLSRLGPSYSRNLGVSISKGDFLLFIDADDLFDSSFVGKAIDRFTRLPLVGAISCFVQCFGFKDYIWFPSGGASQEFLNSNSCPMFSLVRREAWLDTDGFDEDFRIGYEDWDFWLQLTKKNWLIYIIPEVLFFYRQKSDSRVVETFKNHNVIFEQIKNKHTDLYL